MLSNFPIVGKPYRPIKIKSFNAYKGLQFGGGGDLPQTGPSVLKNIMSILPATAPIVNGVDKIKQNITENLNPFGYDHPARRLGSAIIGRKSPERTDRDPTYSESGERDFATERVDLLKMLFNLPQKFNSITPSDFSPSESIDKNKQYYKSSSSEKDIIEQLNERPVKNETDAFFNLQRKSNALGEYKTGYGKDGKGPYVSYYDKWDLNPVPQTGLKWLDKAVDSVVTGLPNALGLTTTPEVYGRVYLDPKTGKPLQKKYGGKIKLINL